MSGIIKSMRIPDCLLVVAVSYISFKYADFPPSILGLITLFAVITVTMLQNDWRDRMHDIGKGKTFAFRNPRLYVVWLTFFWLLSLTLIFLVLQRSFSLGTLLLLMAMVGAFYSEARRVPLLSVTLVTLTVAGSALLPVMLGVPFVIIAPLFISVALIMFGRETLHDIADVEADRDYKKTIPIVVSDKFARVISTIALVVGCLVLSLTSPVATVGSALILFALLEVPKETRLINVRKRIDLGFFLLAIGLIFF